MSNDFEKKFELHTLDYITASAFLCFNININLNCIFQSSLYYNDCYIICLFLNKVSKKAKYLLRDDMISDEKKWGIETHIYFFSFKNTINDRTCFLHLAFTEDTQPDGHFTITHTRCWESRPGERPYSPRWDEQHSHQHSCHSPATRFQHWHQVHHTEWRHPAEPKQDSSQVVTRPRRTFCQGEFHFNIFMLKKLIKSSYYADTDYQKLKITTEHP